MSISVRLDDEQAQALLRRLGEVASNPGQALRASALSLRRLIIDTFSNQTDPWGRRWPRWAPATRAARARLGGSGQVLRLSGNLFRSIDAKGDDQGVTATVGVGAEYASYHQYGNPSHRAWGGPVSPLPQRAFMPERAPGLVDIPAPWWAEILLPVEAALARAGAK
mgnify:CR=1 FL=1